MAQQSGSILGCSVRRLRSYVGNSTIGANRTGMIADGSIPSRRNLNVRERFSQSLPSTIGRLSVGKVDGF